MLSHAFIDLYPEQTSTSTKIVGLALSIVSHADFCSTLLNQYETTSLAYFPNAYIHMNEPPNTPARPIQYANPTPKKPPFVFFHHSSPILDLLTGALALNLKSSVTRSGHLPIQTMLGREERCVVVCLPLRRGRWWWWVHVLGRWRRGVVVGFGAPEAEG